MCKAVRCRSVRVRGQYRRRHGRAVFLSWMIWVRRSPVVRGTCVANRSCRFLPAVVYRFSYMVAYAILDFSADEYWVLVWEISFGPDIGDNQLTSSGTDSHRPTLDRTNSIVKARIVRDDVFGRPSTSISSRWLAERKPGLMCISPDRRGHARRNSG